MTLNDILNVKGTEIFAIDESATLDQVVKKLVKCNCGSLIVMDPSQASRRMVGIVTERDILRACAAQRDPLDETPVTAAMTTDVVTAAPGDSIEDTMQLMTERRLRHLPIVDHGELVGLVSIGDLVKAHHEQCVLENHYLKTYIQS
ncbi:MAG TPA: CBS domain-containing protein [Pirellulales bacterium]|jgi:CBS domain-containing protein